MHKHDNPQFLPALNGEVSLRSSMNTLRELVLSRSNDDRFAKHKKNIMFELNHCELHHIDTYLFNLFNKGVSGLPNKNNSAFYIFYLSMS